MPASPQGAESAGRGAGSRDRLRARGARAGLAAAEPLRAAARSGRTAPFAPVDDVHLVGVRIAEDEEVVSDELELEDCLLRDSSA